MTAPNRTQIRIPVNAVNKIAEQCTLIESRVIGQQAAALTMRMVSPFGYILKCSGEAAVADVSFSDTTFARGMATERVKVAATPEIWAHEGWHMMKVMNVPETVIAPTLANAIHHTLPKLIEVSVNDVPALIGVSASLIYKIASNQAIDIDMLLEMGDFFARPEFKHDADDLQRVADTLTDMCRGILLGYASQFDGDLFAYWNVAKYRLSQATDMHLVAQQSAWYPAISLMVNNVFEAVHQSLNGGPTDDALWAGNSYQSKQAMVEIIARMMRSDGVSFSSVAYDYLQDQCPSPESNKIIAEEIAKAFNEELVNCSKYVNIETVKAILYGV